MDDNLSIAAVSSLHPIIGAHFAPRCLAAQKTKVWLPEKFSFFYMMKLFEQTIESELKDSLGEYETAAERNSRDQQAGVVCGVISDVTPLKCKFLGPRMERKNAIMLAEIWRSLGSCQGHCQQSVRVTKKKTLCAIDRPPRKPRSDYPRTSRSTPGQTFGSPALLIVAPSFTLPVALEGNRLTNGTATMKAT